MRIGVTIGINTKAIDQAKKKDGWFNFTTFIDTDKLDKAGKNGVVKQEHAKGEEVPICGNVKIFWTDNSAPVRTIQPAPQQLDNFDDDIPF